MIYLILLVGAGRFERPTPCAQGGLSEAAKMAYFQSILFQLDSHASLRFVKAY